ncbi:MAG: Gfo/Idh/MocA family oxidoreductase [Acidobacteria bacterium]|nr:Gfo/Idh/MocA family oxidoreductase [Acidobacteriota bacterium]
MLRRTFLGSAAAAVSGRSALAAPSDRITIALMGVRGRGRSLTTAFCAQPDVDVAYVCDVDETVVEEAYKTIEGSGRKRPPLVSDLRRCLDDKRVDAIVMGTPIHWHAPGTVLACAAGKDVYVEKPVSHNVREGRLMVEAARHHKRIVQVGSQLPSLPVTQEFHDYVRSGKLGRVLMAKVWNVQLRRNIGRRSDEAVPAGVDYETWTGPLPKLPFNRNRFHSTVNWHWHYGAGDIANDGVHQLDIARRALGVALPVRVSGFGRKLYFDDDQQTPDTMNLNYEYEDGRLIVYEQRLWNPYGLEGCDNGVAVYGDKGVAQIGRFRGHNWGFRVFDEKNVAVHAAEHDKSSIDTPHVQNFLESMRSRKAPRVEIEEGHWASALAHLGNIVARTGRPIRFDPKTETIADDAEAAALLKRTYRSHWSTPRA